MARGVLEGALGPEDVRESLQDKTPGNPQTKLAISAPGESWCTG